MLGDLLKELELEGNVEVKQKELTIELIGLTYKALSNKIKNIQMKKVMKKSEFRHYCRENMIHARLFSPCMQVLVEPTPVTGLR